MSEVKGGVKGRGINLTVSSSGFMPRKPLTLTETVNAPWCGWGWIL